MSEVTPPPQPPGLPPTPTAAQLKVAVTNPPEAMARDLTLGAKLDAVIAAAQPKGLFQLDTAFGRVAIQTSLQLPTEGPLQLQLLAKGGVLQFLITSIHGMPPQAALRAFGRPPAAPGKAGAQAKTQIPGGSTGPGTGAAGGVPPGAVTRLPPPVNLSVGATLAAILLKGPTPAGATPPSPSTTPGATPGATLGAPGHPPATATPGQGHTPSATGHGAPAGGQGASKGQAPAPGTPAQAPAPRGAGGGVPSAGAATGGTGGLFNVRVTAFQPATVAGAAGGPSSPPPGGLLAPGGVLSGIATGTTSPTGHPIVQTHAGPLALATRTPLPAGSTVTFEVLSQTAPPVKDARPVQTHDLRLPAIMAERWPALQDAVHTLEAVNPGAAQQLVNAVLPQPGAALGSNILFFLMALSGGDLRGWFGDGPTRALQRAKPELLARLRDDFGQIERIAREPGPGEWRTTLIPFLNGAEIDPIRLSLRGAGEDAADGADGAQGTRFVIDLDLSRLGRFQLDGLVHQGEKRMDLIVRTEPPLPRLIEDGIRDIFQDAAGVTGIKGGIVFQAAPPNFIEVLGTEPVDETLGLIV